MRKTILAIMHLVVLCVSVSAQEPAKPAASNGASSTTSSTNGTAAAPAIAITAETSPKDLARAAFLAQGGEKFRAVQNMMLRGSVQLYAPNSVQSIPGACSLV